MTKMHIGDGLVYWNPSTGHRVAVEYQDLTHVYGYNQGTGIRSKIRRENFRRDFERFDADRERTDREAINALSDDTTVTLGEAAKLTLIPYHVLNGAARRGEITGRVMGRSWALHLGAVRAWAALHAHEVVTFDEVPPAAETAAEPPETAAEIARLIAVVEGLSEDIRGLREAWA